MPRLISVLTYLVFWGSFPHRTRHSASPLGRHLEGKKTGVDYAEVRVCGGGDGGFGGAEIGKTFKKCVNTKHNTDNVTVMQHQLQY